MKFRLFLHRFEDIKFKSFRQHFVDLGHLENICRNVINFFFTRFLWQFIFFHVDIIVLFIIFWILVDLRLIFLGDLIIVIWNLIIGIIIFLLSILHLIIITEISLTIRVKFLSIIVWNILNLSHLRQKLGLLLEL